MVLEDKVINALDSSKTLLSVIFFPPPKPKEKFFRFACVVFENPWNKPFKIEHMLLSVNSSLI